MRFSHAWSGSFGIVVGILRIDKILPGLLLRPFRAGIVRIFTMFTDGIDLLLPLIDDVALTAQGLVRRDVVLHGFLQFCERKPEMSAPGSRRCGLAFPTGVTIVFQPTCFSNRVSTLAFRVTARRAASANGHGSFSRMRTEWMSNASADVTGPNSYHVTGAAIFAPGRACSE